MINSSSPEGIAAISASSSVNEIDSLKSLIFANSDAFTRLPTPFSVIRIMSPVDSSRSFSLIIEIGVPFDLKYLVKSTPISSISISGIDDTPTLVILPCESKISKLSRFEIIVTITCDVLPTIPIDEESFRLIFLIYPSLLIPIKCIVFGIFSLIFPAFTT